MDMTPHSRWAVTSARGLFVSQLDMKSAPEDKVTPFTDTQAMPPEGVTEMVQVYLQQDQNPGDPLVSPFLPRRKPSRRREFLSPGSASSGKRAGIFACKLMDAGVEVLLKSYEFADKTYASNFADKADGIIE